MRGNRYMWYVLAAVISAASLAFAVTFGEPDGDSHPYVGTLIFRTPSGLFSCSGTLLSPTVLLTAGHCTEENGTANLKTWVKFTPEISFAGVGSYPSIDAFLDDPANGWIVGDAVPHPLYDDYRQFPRTYDVGVILLRTSVPLAMYGSLPPQGFLETIRRRNENKFTVVGYGQQGAIRPFYGDLFERYRGSVRLVELNSTFDAGMSAKFTNNPGIGGGSCFGDSGGPVFYGDTNMVVAVVSWGITPCIGVNYQFRVDTALALGFLSPLLP